MPKVALTVEKTTDALKRQGVLLSLSIHTSKEKKMTHFYSGLMSWMKGETVGNDRYRTELMTWAKTEYKNDWRFAYDFMLSHNGRAPTYAELNATIRNHFKIKKEAA